MLGFVKTYLLLAKEGIQNPAQNGLQTGADHVEGESVFNAVLVEFTETRVDLESLLHNREAVVEGDVQGSPHLLGDVAEGPLAGLDLFIELVAGFLAAAVVVEEDVACVLHEDGAIEVYAGGSMLVTRNTWLCTQLENKALRVQGQGSRGLGYNMLRGVDWRAG